MMIPVMLGVTFIVFSMIYFTPGDPAEFMLGMDATPASVAALRKELGLDKPFLIQYFNYIKNIVTKGDFGTSYVTRRSVTNEILDRFHNTLMLAFLSMILSAIVGVVTGIISATRQYSFFDNISTVFALTGISIPAFWGGMMLIIIFSVSLGWLPSSGFEKPLQWILPTITVGMGGAASVMRQTRSSMLEVIRQDYIATARAKGQGEIVIIFKHALRNALIPVITVIGITFGVQLGGAILTETIFTIPGLGKLMVDSISVRNYPVVQSGVLFIALCFSCVNLIVDVLYAFIDPRIRSQYAKGGKGKK